jgi:lipid-A-disaccharide synthase
MNKKYNNFTFVFHSTKEYSNLITSYLKEENLKNCEVISDNKIKNHFLNKSVFAVAKSGTVSLEICNAKIPSIILYKMGLINFLIVKMLVKTKFANIINIAAKKEIIPELLQSNCNPKKIFENVSNYLDNPEKIDEQVKNTQLILSEFKTNISPSNLAAESLNKFLN